MSSMKQEECKKGIRVLIHTNNRIDVGTICDAKCGYICAQAADGYKFWFTPKEAELY